MVYSVGGVGYYEANDVLTMSILTTCHIAPEKARSSPLSEPLTYEYGIMFPFLKMDFDNRTVSE